MKSGVNRKGFTLAELLIIVAIIAILVAVAIPVFRGAFDKAKRAVEDADVRAVKAVAVTELLSNPGKYDIKAGTDEDGWYVLAYVDASGTVSVSDFKISRYSAFYDAYIRYGNHPGYRVVSDYAVVIRDGSGGMTVVLFLKPIDLTSSSAGG